MDVVARLREAGYWVRVEGDRIKCSWQGEGKPDPETVRPLLAELKAQKAEALETLRRESAEVEAPTVDPFDTSACLPPGLIVTLPDQDRPGWWTARRVGTLTPEGHGPDQVEAILDLDRREQDHGTT